MQKFGSTRLIQRVVADQKEGRANGITSICSASSHVIKAGIQEALQNDSWLLVESTCNQVNQDGGYTGLKPADFVRFMGELAEALDFPTERILLGGDHLGPNPWKDQPSSKAMEKARNLVRDYVKAGYRKIHLDTSMPCADDDPSDGFNLEKEAKRAAELCQIAEETSVSLSDDEKPVYVIGSEVPKPGGTEDEDEGLQVTRPENLEKEIRVYREVFQDNGLGEAWNRVIAFVVQPGVEFGQFSIHEYQPEAARPLVKYVEEVPGIIYEAHSTDYQLPGLLQKLVADHFAILKVGPALTFAFREAVFSLAQIESEWLIGKKTDLSNLIAVVDQTMVENPEDWEGYYHGSEIEKAFARKYSLSDRIRYYWSYAEVEKALDVLINNLTENPPPLAIISQFLPNQYHLIREGLLKNEPEAIIFNHIQHVLADYRRACEP